MQNKDGFLFTISSKHKSYTKFLYAFVYSKAYKLNQEFSESLRKWQTFEPTTRSEFTFHFLTMLAGATAQVN
jgi:hypothetical protein